MTNLQLLKKTRKKQQPGDVFAMLMPDEQYLFGRVITLEASIRGMVDVLLLYVYQVRSEEMELPERAELRADRLLVAPMMTNRRGWTQGLFQTIGNIPLDERDLLHPNCFKSVNGKHYDERSNELPGPVGLVGQFGLHSFRTIDDRISTALGFELVPD